MILNIKSATFVKCSNATFSVKLSGCMQRGLVNFVRLGLGHHASSEIITQRSLYRIRTRSAPRYFGSSDPVMYFKSSDSDPTF